MTPVLLDLLAAALLSGASGGTRALTGRIERLLGRRPAWAMRVARGFREEFGPPGAQPRPRHRDVVEWLARDGRLVGALSRVKLPGGVSEWIPEPARMQPVAVARAWPVPVIESTGALADWLGLSVDELEWFADLKRLAARAGPASAAHHYFYRAFGKPGGGGIRLVEAPKPQLKMLQHRILHGLLSALAPHPAAHGFRSAHSIVTYAAPHAGQAAVLRLDLAHFFPSIGFARIAALFRTAGYPEPVADRLAGICTNSTPRAAWPRQPGTPGLVEAVVLHARRHLPQGAPSSPALANLCAWRLDCRLAGLAASVDAVYTRYADDLAFSGDAVFARSAGRLTPRIAAVVSAEGYTVNHRKTHLMREGVQQRLAGLVVNGHLNVARPEFDALKATLHNCARFGPASQNRDGHPAFREHLAGRVAFVESVNAPRGARLREMLGRIDWPR